MGSLTSSKERFLAWRTIDGRETDPLGTMRELETLTRGLFRRDYLLDYLHHFILFEDEGALVKKIAAYHQFHAVRAVVDSVLHASAPGGSRKGGVVWHTQGAGKSIEMTCFAGALMASAEMQNPTLLVVTDRNDLDNQLFGVFAGASELLRETPVQADTRTELRRLLANRPSGGIIFTTIQKFTPGEDEDTFPVLSDRHNIVVICDEAHRSQYGFDARLTDAGKNGASPASSAVRYGYAQYLRDALPSATFVAFTGTPVSLDDRDTRAVFGDYVHVYDIEQAVNDGATVPIYYESRLAALELKEADTDDLDDQVDELTEDEANDESKVATLRRWAALEKIVGAPPRVQKIAADIVAHFENRLAALDGKAMVVAMSRDICVHLYNAIVALRPEWHSDDPMQGVIKIVMTGSASDKALLKPHIYPKDIRKKLELRYKDTSDSFKVVIVRDMWLTGFDAPCMHTMYIDKPMKGHADGKVFGTVAAESDALQQSSGADFAGHRRAYRDGQTVPGSRRARRAVGAEQRRDGLLRCAGDERGGGARTRRRYAEENRGRAGREAARLGHGRLGEARHRAREATGDGQDATQALQVSARPAGGGDRYGASAGGNAVGGLGSRLIYPPDGYGRKRSLSRYLGCPNLALLKTWPSLDNMRVLVRRVCRNYAVALVARGERRARVAERAGAFSSARWSMTTGGRFGNCATSSSFPPMPSM